MAERGNVEVAKLKSQANCVYQYWKVDGPKSRNGKISIHPEKHMLNIAKYKEELWKCIEPFLEVYGLAETKIEKLRDELLN